MAASIPFRGSGKFVPEREWTCSQHDWPLDHECDCSCCGREWDCDECATARWQPAVNADGTPKMREVGFYESALLEHFSESTTLRKSSLVDLLERQGAGESMPVFRWMEDEAA